MYSESSGGQYSMIRDPMVMWHLDSYDELLPWQIRLYGAIDEGSHFVLWKKVSPQTHTETIFEGYSEAVEKYGHLLRIRILDPANEHEMVRDDIERARPNVFQPYLTASSVHNQPIRKYWQVVGTHCTFFYKHLISLMSGNGTLDIETPCTEPFVPAIQEDLDKLVAMWNLHRIRKISQNGGSIIPSRVPTLVFKPYERENGLLLPLEDNAAPPLHRPPIEFTREDSSSSSDNEDVEDIDPSSKLAAAKIVRLRDQAYELDKDNVKELNMKFELHLSLIMECIEANQSAAGFRRHLLSVMATAEPKQSYAAKLLVEAGDSRAEGWT